MALAEDFSLIMLKGQTDQLDIVDLFHQSKTKEAFQARIVEYEDVNLRLGQLIYVYIEQPKQAYQTNPTAIQAILKAPTTARTAQLTVTEDEEDAILALEFFLPALEMKKLNQTLKSTPKEAF